MNRGVTQTCSTCAHGIKYRGSRRCVRDLVIANVPKDSIRDHLAIATECADERSRGPLMAWIMMSCGQNARYWTGRER